MKLKRLITCSTIALLVNTGAAEMRDPTLPPYYVSSGNSAENLATTKNRFHLNSIIITANHHIALVNNTYVKEGDTVNNYQVKLISPNYVVLANSEENITLHLFRTVRNPLGSTQ